MISHASCPAILGLAKYPENGGTDGYLGQASQRAADCELAGPTAQQRSNHRGECRVEYKVVTQKDRMFGGKFNPEQVQNGLNSYAEEGWTLKAVATATFPSLGGGREELVMFLEREK